MILKTFMLCTAIGTASITTASAAPNAKAEAALVAKEATRTKNVQAFQAKNTKVFSVFVKGFC